MARETKNMKTEVKQMPEIKFRAGNVSATVWKHTEKIDNRDVDFYNVVIEKSYKDKKDEWQKSSSFQKNDLMKVEVVLRKAQEYLYLADDKDNEELTY